MLKKLVAVLLVLLVVMSHTVAYGQNDSSDFNEKPIITPQYTHIYRFMNTLQIENEGRALINVFLTANSGTSTSLEVQLQRYQSGNWTTIKTWQQSRSGTNISISESWYIVSGYYYRTVATGRVYQNGVLVEQDSELSSSIWW